MEGIPQQPQGLRGRNLTTNHMGVSKNMGKPPNHPILIAFSIIFTIHFGGFPPIFGNTHIHHKKNTKTATVNRPWLNPPILQGPRYFGPTVQPRRRTATRWLD